MKIRRIIEMLLTILGIMAMMWFVASYFDVVFHNLDEHPTYQVWNIFHLLTK